MANKTLQRLKATGHSINPLLLVILVVIGAIIIWFTWWFLHSFERVSRVDYALKTQTQYNPYYAAQLLINDQYTGIDTDTGTDNDNSGDMDASDIDSNASIATTGIGTTDIATTLLDSDLKMLIDELPAIDPTSDYRPTLIINSIGTRLTEERFAALKSWIEQGGHLITFTSERIDHDEMQAALERLSALQKVDTVVNPETVANDEALNELRLGLDSGNTLLNQLGIYLVRSESGLEDDLDLGALSDDLEAQVEQILEEAEAQQQQQEKLNEDYVPNKIEALLKTQPLSLLTLNNHMLMVEVDHDYYSNHDQLNSQLFAALYPNSERLEVQQRDIKSQAAMIRAYINGTNIASQKHARQNLHDTVTPLSAKDSQKNSSSAESIEDDDVLNKLPELLSAMLALEDEQLVDLFYPADAIYLDTTLGQGRLSVVSDSAAFSNPNPNIEMLDTPGMGTDNVSTLPVTALHELLDTGYTLSLLSADNTAWLLALTEDSDTVWILPNTDVDPLPLMLWKHARPALLGLGLLAVLWLWSLYNRFGKMTTLPTRQSRDIMRYFQQVGRFGWHQDNAQKLTAATRDKVRTLVNERLQGTEYQQNPSLPNTIAPIPIAELHQALVARLQDKKERLDFKVIDSELTDTKLNEADLLVHNEDFIRDTITPNRLRAALEGSSTQALEFTEMTQTLWAVQWLLK